MAGIHLFGQNEYGTACIRCGYFSHTEEAGKECSGAYDKKALIDIEEGMHRLEDRKRMIEQAQAAQT